MKVHATPLALLEVKSGVYKYVGMFENRAFCIITNSEIASSEIDDAIINGDSIECNLFVPDDARLTYKYERKEKTK